MPRRKVLRLCKICGNEFMTGSYPRLTCSEECRQKSTSQSQKQAWAEWRARQEAGK